MKLTKDIVQLQKLVSMASRFLRAMAMAGITAGVMGAVTMPQIFSDGMVLQDHATYDQRPFVYGQADVGEIVNVNRTLPGQAPEVRSSFVWQPCGASSSDCSPDAALFCDGRRHGVLDRRAGPRLLRALQQWSDRCDCCWLGGRVSGGHDNPQRVVR